MSAAEPLSQCEINALALKLVVAMPSSRLEFVPSTGEALSHAAMKLARVYDKSTDSQKKMLDSIVAGFGRV